MPRKRQGFVISKYLHKPHLINGYKYDLRIYILVTSYDPLVIYMYEDGLARFSTEKYSINPKTLKKRFIHLTNYSIQKKADGYKATGVNDEVPAEGEGEEQVAKWSYK